MTEEKREVGGGARSKLHSDTATASLLPGWLENVTAPAAKGRAGGGGGGVCVCVCGGGGGGAPAPPPPPPYFFFFLTKAG